jgi:uncharacterized protein YkwD
MAAAVTARKANHGLVVAPTLSANNLEPVPDLEAYMVELVNRDRAANHVSPPLRVNPALTKVAREHALDMIKNKYFEHADKQGRSPRDRANAAGITAMVHENISQSYASVPGTSAKELVSRCEAQMMGEPPNVFNHRGNILGTSHRTVGIGVYFTGTLVMTDQEFCDEDI